MAQTGGQGGSSPGAKPAKPKPQPQPKPPPPPKPPPKKAAAGAPGAGAGGQKAGGAAVPPKKGPQQKPAAAAPKPQPARPLTPQQTKQLAKAQASGNEAQYLANHPGVAKHQQKIGAPATGASGQKGSQPPAAAGAPPPGNPAGGAGGNKTPPPGAPPPAATPDAAAPAAAPEENTFEQGFNAQFGKGAMNQFGNMGWYGANPIDTAWKAGEQGLQKDLAGIRERFGQGGMGTSSQNLLAQQSAASDFETQFADKAAQLGVGARENDLNRLATMFAGAGEQQLAGKQQELQANQQLANLGTGLTAIGAQEQQIPNLSEMGSILANFGNVRGFNRGAMNPPAK